MKTTKLPEKLSDLILVALADLERAEKDPRYRINMDAAYHQPNGKCTVCFAGAVMAFGLGVAPTVSTDPYELDDKAEGKKLLALDDVRSGYLELENREMVTFSVTPYKSNRERWKTEMVLTACALKELGL